MSETEKTGLDEKSAYVFDPALVPPHVSNPPSNAHKNIPFEIILQYKHRGFNNCEIAKVLGCDESNIRTRLRHVDSDPEATKYFKDNKNVIFEKMQADLLSLSSSNIKDMSGLQRVTAAGILYDKQRLEEGKSTQNVDNRHQYYNNKQDLDKMREKLQALGVDVVDIEPS